MVDENSARKVIELVKAGKGKPVPFMDIYKAFQSPSFPPGGCVDIPFVQAFSNLQYLKNEGFIREEGEGVDKGYVMGDIMQLLAAQGEKARAQESAAK
jgi:hypothetical protein